MLTDEFFYTFNFFVGPLVSPQLSVYMYTTVFIDVFGLQRLTGGIVIWMEGPAAVIYRGKDYVPGWIRKFEEREEAYRERLQSLGLDEEDEREQFKEEKTSCYLQETEIEELLDDLGPQYTEWNEGGHVPIDGDLLLPPDSGFKSPFRRLPYGVRPRLNNFEMTEMRHLARKLPPHFALGGYLKTCYEKLMYCISFFGFVLF